MNFKDVTDIVLPNGDLAKITDSSGRVLWGKPKKVTGVEFGGIPNALSTVGYTCGQTARVIYADGSKVNGKLTNESFVWKTNNVSVVALENTSGAFTALRSKSLGTAVITCSIRNGKFSDSITVKVIWTS